MYVICVLSLLFLFSLFFFLLYFIISSHKGEDIFQAVAVPTLQILLLLLTTLATLTTLPNQPTLPILPPLPTREFFFSIRYNYHDQILNK